MKKSHIAILLVFFLLIPLTLFLGNKLPGRSFYITGTAIIVELMIPFFMAFEGRKPQARELVVIAVLCAIAIAARVAIPIPHFKAIFAVVMLAGIAFGPEAGFAVGAISAFASNFFYTQGPETPWQKMAYGAGGMAAGFCIRKELFPRKPLPMALFGFFCVVLWIGPLLDTSSLFLMATVINWKSAVTILASGLPANISQAISTALTLALLGKPFLDKLNRIQVKYGMLDGKAQH